MTHDLIEADNVDVKLLIGGDRWDIIDCEVVLSKRSTPDYADVIITPGEGIRIPSKPQRTVQEGGEVGKSVSLAVDNELAVRRPDVDEEQKIIFENWQVANMTATGAYTFEAIFHDPTQEPFQHQVEETENRDETNFMNSTIEIAQPTPAEERLPAGGYYEQAVNPGERKILTSELIGLIVSEAGVSANINVRGGGQTVGVTENGTEIKKAEDIELTFSSWEVTVKNALERASQATNSRWWFERDGTFNFGPVVPDEDISAYELKYITDASDGKLSPPYKSVRVIGDGVVSSESGWGKSALIKEARFGTSGNVNIDTDAAKLADPSFVYRNMEINTEREARNTREKILEELREQQGGGEVTVVGFPEIRPLDRIDMPSSDRQPMGGESYGVEQVTHRLNSSDGFITKLKLMGLIDEARVFTRNGEKKTVKDLEREIEAAWTGLRRRLPAPNLSDEGPESDQAVGTPFSPAFDAGSAADVGPLGGGSVDEDIDEGFESDTGDEDIDPAFDAGGADDVDPAGGIGDDDDDDDDDDGITPA